jgi:predicted transcriptional regulator of viral defense system
MNMDIKEILEKNNGFLRAKDLTSRNQWNQLKMLIDNNVVIKLKSGLYSLPRYNVIDQNREVAQIVPSGVLCMFSAWQHYNLTLNNPFEYHIAIRREDKIALPDYPPIKLYHWSEKFYYLGIIETDTIKIYDLEKSVCDAVRFRNKVGMDIAIEVVKNYVQKREERNFDKLTKYARLLRIDKIMQSIIMPML